MPRLTPKEIKRRVPIDKILAHYGVTLNEKGRGRCVFSERHTHGDADPSLSIQDNRAKCWSQGCPPGKLSIGSIKSPAHPNSWRMPKRQVSGSSWMRCCWRMR